MSDESGDVSVGQGYPLGQFAQAFVTAVTHEDPRTRERARDRVDRWRKVLAGMASDALRVGSRTPVGDLPPWVTLEVVRGGFATGTALAGGGFEPYERDLAREAGVREERGAVFAHLLSERGLELLAGLLRTGRYTVKVPEEAALLTVAWLVGAGDTDAAFALLDEIGPYAESLRFAPRPSDAPPGDPTVVFREDAATVRAAVAERRPDPRVEAMREALAVWNPFADALLAHWLDTVEDGRVVARVPDGWLDRGRDLLARYEALAAAHTRCTKHRRPKENLAILRTALAEVVAGRALAPRQRGLLQHAVDAMVARRGAPGSRPHAALRGRQAADASLPAFHAIAQVVAARLGAVPPDSGLESTAPFTGPVTEEEERRHGVPAGTPVPPTIAAVLDRAIAAPVDRLVERGLVPSAEVLAALVPRIAAAVTSSAYEDDALRTLMAATYRAFRARRSLLLLDLAHQVRLDELPWVAAVEPYQRRDETSDRDTTAALVRLGELALEAFPGTILPNPLVAELSTLAREARLSLPFVEELAADIFEGAFTAKFPRAALLAADLLRGSVYDRYYDVGYAAMLAGGPASSPEEFARWCTHRASVRRLKVFRSTAANGMVIEQEQIATTHNLAALVAAGVAPSAGWAELARRAFAVTCAAAGRVPGNRRPLSHVKEAAYAWRQAVFFLALAGNRAQAEFLAEASATVEALPPGTARLLRPVVAGLSHVVRGGAFGPDGTAGEARRFLAWSADGHWMVALSGPTA